MSRRKTDLNLFRAVRGTWAAVGSFAALRMRHTPCGCRFVCDAAAFRNHHLLQISTDLFLPAGAALLRSPRYVHYR